EELDRLTQAVGTALEGQLMTREELAKRVGKLMRSPRLGSKLAQGSWGTMLRPAAFAGNLCFGPSVGQRVRFTRPDTWLASELPRVDPRMATADVTRRVLAVHGPATYHDLARWWNGGGVPTARQWIAALGDEVCEVDLDGTQAWMLTKDASEAREASLTRSLRLLPGFDQYVVTASYHAERLLPG